MAFQQRRLLSEKKRNTYQVQYYGAIENMDIMLQWYDGNVHVQSSVCNNYCSASDGTIQSRLGDDHL
jgi:hypothetical protein